MALSNIFREPRREITETVIGAAIVCAALYADYHFALWFQEVTGGDKGGCPWPIGMFFGVSFGGAAIGLTFAAHALGEGICNRLQATGIHLRPRERR